MLKVTIEGAKQVINKLDNAVKRSKQLERVVHKAALFVAGEAKQRAPVDTGHLRRSITAVTERRGVRVLGRVGTNVHYAPHIEFGRKRVITPVRARALRFTVKEFIGTKGRSRLKRDVVFAKRAEAGKPGQKTATWERVAGDRIAKPFLRPALRASQPKIRRLVNEFVAQVFK
jgi:HK97 gp10 family phage protein